MSPITQLVTAVRLLFFALLIPILGYPLEDELLHPRAQQDLSLSFPATFYNKVLASTFTSTILAEVNHSSTHDNVKPSSSVRESTSSSSTPTPTSKQQKLEAAKLDYAATKPSDLDKVIETKIVGPADKVLGPLDKYVVAPVENDVVEPIFDGEAVKKVEVPVEDAVDAVMYPVDAAIDRLALDVNGDLQVAKEDDRKFMFF